MGVTVQSFVINMRLLVVTAWISAVVDLSWCNYLSVPPVKLLEEESMAKRYPASNSSYRTALENGKDELTDRTDVEVLNKFPPEKLTLSPGGCAHYAFPIQPDQKYMFVQPARTRKDGALYPDYCHKGKTVITAKNSGQKSFTCFIHPEDCSPKSCLGDIGTILNPSSKASQQVHIDVCNDPKSASEAAIWELNFSSSNDTNKLKAIFTPDARLRLRNTAKDPVANTQLTMVSMVGDRGVGKSTIASLLSGNETLFQAGSSSTGTTTTGADVSGVIPTFDYSSIVSQKLKRQISKPNQNLPFFLIDSEGMNVRGNSFDFMTTSPPAVVGKVIIWVGAENVQTAKILESVENYLDGLDQIILDGHDSGTNCQTPQFGHFVIVINKMMGAKTDQQLYQELMTVEPDYIPGYDKRNAVRQKLKQCFAQLTVHGLPLLYTPNVNYDALNDRFRDGLAKISDSVIDASLSPRTITVGSVSLIMNSTNAERIMATVIDEANKGKMDLTGFDAFWTSISFQVSIQLQKVKDALTDSSKNCETGGKVCSPCVCAYRNKVVEMAFGSVNEVMEIGVRQATTMFKVNASKNAQQLFESDVNPWKLELTCTSNSKFPFDHTKTGVCDSSIVNFTPITSCNVAYICNSKDISYSPSITLNGNGIYFHDGASLNLLPPAKAANGANGASPGTSGTNGAGGIKGANLNINVKRLLEYSSNSVTILARGGEGGNGGNGMSGAKGANGVKGADGRAGANGATGGKGADNTNIPAEQWQYFDIIFHNGDAVKANGKLISNK